MPRLRATPARAVRPESSARGGVQDAPAAPSECSSETRRAIRLSRRRRGWRGCRAVDAEAPFAVAAGEEGAIKAPFGVHGPGVNADRKVGGQAEAGFDVSTVEGEGEAAQGDARVEDAVGAGDALGGAAPGVAPGVAHGQAGELRGRRVGDSELFVECVVDEAGGADAFVGKRRVRKRRAFLRSTSAGCQVDFTVSFSTSTGGGEELAFAGRHFGAVGPGDHFARVAAPQQEAVEGDVVGVAGGAGEGDGVGGDIDGGVGAREQGAAGLAARDVEADGAAGPDGDGYFVGGVGLGGGEIDVAENAAARLGGAVGAGGALSGCGLPGGAGFGDGAGEFLVDGAAAGGGFQASSALSSRAAK